MRAGEEKNQPRRFPICETSTWTIVSMSEVSNTTGIRPFRAGPEVIINMIRGLEHLCSAKKAERIWAVQPEKMKASRRPYRGLSIHKIQKKDVEWLFIKVCSDR